MKKKLNPLLRTSYLKKTITKSMALMLVCSSVLTGCGSDSKGSTAAVSGKLADAGYTLDKNTPAWKIDKTKDNKLTWYVNADWWNTDYGNDTITKKIKADLNLDIEFIKGDDTKLNTYFAGEKMPDIVTLFDPKSSTALKADSWAYSLQDLADKYDPYFYKVAKDQTLSWYKLGDGKTYGYPSFSNTQADYDDGYVQGTTNFAVRQDIYKAIGEPDMSTPEGFLSALKAMKEKYPDVAPFGFNPFGKNGDTGSLGSAFQDFLGVEISTADKKFYNRNLDENYLAWIKVINEAYKSGLISEDNFADDATIFEEKIAAGKYATMFVSGTPQRSGALQKNIAQDPNRKYIAIDGPTSGKKPTLSQTGLSGWTVTYISKKCKNPQKAMQIFTYLLDEPGQYLTFYGVEGETYKINAEGKAVLLPEVKKLQSEDSEQFKKINRLGEFWFFGNDGFKFRTAEEPKVESIKQMSDWTKGKLKPQFIIENIEPDQGTAEARSLTNINTNWATTLASLLRAKDSTEFDTIVSDYKKFLNDNNFDSIVKIRNEKIAKNVEKLGLK